MKWITEQTWEQVLFLHWQVDAKRLQDQVPFELDLYQGNAVLSIVPFQMNDIRFPFIPVVPHFSRLLELNIRTYVKHQGKRGIYFFTLDTDSKMGAWIANSFFHLPYRLAKISACFTNEKYKFESERENYSFQVEANIQKTSKVKTEFDHWALERYHLFTKTRSDTYRGDVFHEPWVLSEVKINQLTDHFSKQVEGVHLSPTPFSVNYCRSLRVRFTPFEKMT